MRYVFICDKCQIDKEIFNPIKVGPPKDVLCNKCGNKMYQDFDGHFVLRGDNWAGKQARRDNNLELSAEKAEKYLASDSDKRKESKEVIENRRKGKEHFKEWSKHNKKKVERYHNNLKDGIRVK